MSDYTLTQSNRNLSMGRLSHMTPNMQKMLDLTEFLLLPMKNYRYLTLFSPNCKISKVSAVSL